MTIQSICSFHCLTLVALMAMALFVALELLQQQQQLHSLNLKGGNNDKIGDSSMQKPYPAPAGPEDDPQNNIKICGCSIPNTNIVANANNKKSTSVSVSSNRPLISTTTSTTLFNLRKQCNKTNIITLGEPRETFGRTNNQLIQIFHTIEYAVNVNDGNNGRVVLYGWAELIMYKLFDFESEKTRKAFETDLCLYTYKSLLPEEQSKYFSQSSDSFSPVSNTNVTQLTAKNIFFRKYDYPERKEYRKNMMQFFFSRPSRKSCNAVNYFGLGE